MDLSYFLLAFPPEPGVWHMLWHLTMILVGAKLLILLALFVRDHHKSI